MQLSPMMLTVEGLEDILVQIFFHIDVLISLLTVFFFVARLALAIFFFNFK